MQRVTSAHYEILCPPGALTQAAMTEFAARREPLFTALDKKLGGADSNRHIRIVFDPNFPRRRPMRALRNRTRSRVQRFARN